MKKYMDVIKRSKLFAGVSEADAEAMIKCISAREKILRKGEYAYRTGDRPKEAAMVLDGAMRIEREDYWGNKSIIAEIPPAEMLGETYACTEGEPMSVNAVASMDTVLLMLDMRRVLRMCPSPCPYHMRLAENLIRVLAYRNITLTRKIEHISQRTTRGKLISYFSEQAVKKGSPSFTIPFDRQQLADFLSVDRSAMSKELSRMRDEGILQFKKNSFTLNGNHYTADSRRTHQQNTE